MKPKCIFLVRHGESQGNTDDTLYKSVPDYALHLTAKGIREATQAGVEIKKRIGAESLWVYLSPYYRTRETYQRIRESVRENVIREFEDPRLREQDWGHLKTPEEGDDIGRARDEFGHFYYRIPDGESGADVYDRVSTFLETLHRDFARPDYAQNTLIVTHGLTLRLFLMRWFHWSVEEFENLRIPKNGDVFVMERQENERYRLINELRRRNPKVGPFG